MRILHQPILSILFSLIICWSSASAQTYTVLHAFTGGRDGGFPYAGLTKGQSDTFYGTTCQGGIGVGYGVVYSITNSAAGVSFTVIHRFDGLDGNCPVNKVIFGPDGALYGTTRYGSLTAGGLGWGTVFRLQPPPATCNLGDCEWSETVLYRFQGQNDGGNPEGDLIFDRAGNIYGTATQGGIYHYGLVFQLHPANGRWVESVLYTFTGFGDGGSPGSGVILDAAGNLYGTAGGGPNQLGVVFELSPSGSGWTESVLHGFTGNDGAQPDGGLVSDGAGNLYGATAEGGPENVGVAYELTPSGGTWIYQTLHSFTFSLPPGGGPEDALLRDEAGNLYGSQVDNPSGSGGIFKLAAGDWTETDIHVFESCSDGCNPTGSVTLDEHGNILGTTLASEGAGVVWEITP